MVKDIIFKICIVENYLLKLNCFKYCVLTGFKFKKGIIRSIINLIIMNVYSKILYFIEKNSFNGIFYLFSLKNKKK